MSLKRKSAIGGLAMLTLIATSAAALAATAYTTSPVNVRTGPGTGYHAVDTLHRGEAVDVQYCRGTWCFVEKNGPDGWVSSNYLERGRPRVQRPRLPDPNWGNDWDYPDWYLPNRPYPIYPSDPHSRVCFSGPNGYFCVGD